MPTISKELNQHNPIRWVRLTGMDLAYLQQFGLFGDKEQAVQIQCGMSFQITKDVVARSITAKMTFTKAAYPVYMALETQDGQVIVGFQQANQITASGLAENTTYIVKAYAVDDVGCTAETEVYIPAVCGIKAQVYQNKSSVIITHSYAQGSFNTEYSLYNRKAFGEEMSDYPTAVRNRWDISNLPDGDYTAVVKKVGTGLATSAGLCQATYNFSVKNDYIQLINFKEQDRDEVLSGVGSDAFTLRNNGTGNKTALLTLVSTIGGGNLTVYQDGAGSEYTGRRAIELAPGAEVDVVVSAVNGSGVNRYVVISVEDKDTTSNGILLIANNKIEYVKKASITLTSIPEGGREPQLPGGGGGQEPEIV